MILDILLNALILSLVLLGIHSYFGMEIIRRGMIFVDLAIAQGAAVGIALSVYMDKESLASYLSVLFALLSAFLVYLAESKENYKEAVIGILYALFVSLGFLLLSKSPHGAENFLKLTASDILFNSRNDILYTALLYGFLGILIFLKNRYTKGKIKNLLFYILFALTVSSSIKLAGVLVVFSLLLAPALMSVYLRKGLSFAWMVGSLINVSAIFISYQMDLPTGFSIVFFHALSALLTVIIFKS